MAAGDFLNVLSKPFTRDSPLKFDWEEAIVFSSQNMNWYCWPALEAAGLGKDSLGFLALLLRAGTQHLLGDVMQEVRRHIEFRRITAANGSVFSGLTAAVAPHHAPAVSLGLGIMAFTNTRVFTGARAQTSGAVKPASD
jgi:hypothetical protein